MESEIKELSLKFIQQVSSKVKLNNYDKDEWFKGAFFTIQRTIKGGLSNENRSSLKNILFDSIEKLKKITPSEGKYDKWFNNIISSINFLSYGQAQKIINILMKYHYCYYYSKADNEFRWLYQFFDFFHAPLDNILLYNLKQKFDNENICSKIKAWVYRDNYNGVFLTQGIEVRWSRLEKNNAYLYKDVQDFIRGKVKESEHWKNRLHFEMKELWISATTPNTA
ncbi:MAG TPA: hypothetical protein EYP22_05135 [Methanosarcinales archaeon]|nr:hypothetical protein [Methanosarcinales archaeon]